MKNKVVFTETQRFNQWWLWLIVAGLNGGLIAAAAIQRFSGRPFGNKPMSDTEFLVVIAVSILISLLFLSFRLETQIREDAVYVRFFPFHRRFQCYTWEELSKIFVRKYSPIAEYGGWGYRIGWPGQGGAYNVSGNQGLQLEFKKGKKLLIGTQQPEAVAAALKKIGKYQE
jgi:hypothetical protein